MKRNCSNLLILSLLLLSASAELLFVAEIFNEGEYSPYATYKEDKFTNGPGMLTAKGFQRHYNIGKELRKKYVNDHEEDEKLLSKYLDPSEIYFRSSQLPRCIQSAEAQAHELYPPKDFEILYEGAFNKFLKEEEEEEEMDIKDIKGEPQKIKVDSFDESVDKIGGYENCEFISEQIKRTINNSSRLDIFDNDHEYIYKFIVKTFDMKTTEFTPMIGSYLSQILVLEDAEGLEPRYKFNEDEFMLIKMLSYSFHRMILENGAQKLIAIRHLAPVFELIKQKMNMSYNKKLLAEIGAPKFFGMAVDQFTMDAIHKQMPSELKTQMGEFGTNIVFELHKQESRSCRMFNYKSCYSVKVFMNGEQKNYYDECENSAECTMPEIFAGMKERGLNMDVLSKECAKKDNNLSSE